MQFTGAHGQPSPAFNRKRRLERDLSEMLGLVKGMLADGVVNDQEALFLRDWGARHPDVILRWPHSLVFSRLTQICADGRVDDAERQELHKLCADLIGGTTSLLLGYDAPATLPLDQPPPLICWGPDEVYVFTGRFAWGTRSRCECEVLNRGSSYESNVTRRTTFLVVGSFSSEDWAHSSYGRKIERAAELRASGFPVRIVGEDHWVSALGATAAA